MKLTGGNWVLVIVAIVVIGFGVVSSGIVPGLSVAPPSTPTAKITLASQTGNPYAVQATLANSYGAVAIPVGYSFSTSLSWGDATPLMSNIPANGVQSHTYQKAGNYTVVDTITFSRENLTAPGHPIVWSENYTAAVKIGIPSSTNPVTNVSAGTITPTFAWTLSNKTFTAHDTSTASGGAGIATSSYRWTFGDGTIGQGATVTHNYGQAGSYNVTETFSGTTGGSIYKNYTASQVIVVKATPTTTPPVTGTGGAASPAPAVSFGAIQLGAIVGGLVLLVWQFVPGIDKRYLLGLIVAGGLGFASYLALVSSTTGAL